MDMQLELEDLMHQTLPIAKSMLTESGGFVPYGAVMRPDGEVLPVGLEDMSSDMKAGEVVDLLRTSMVGMAAEGDCKATAVFYAVRVSLPGTTETTDAVAVDLSHQAGEALMVFHPFNRVGCGIHYGNAFAYHDQNKVFTRLH